MFENISHPRQPQKTYRCPCCHCKTPHARAGYELCPVCFWEDDLDHDVDQMRGSPNGTLSLAQGRSNFLKFSAYDPKFSAYTSLPLDDEK